MRRVSLPWVYRFGVLPGALVCSARAIPDRQPPDLPGSDSPGARQRRSFGLPASHLRRPTDLCAKWLGHADYACKSYSSKTDYPPPSTSSEDVVDATSRRDFLVRSALAGITLAQLGPKLLVSSARGAAAPGAATPGQTLSGLKASLLGGVPTRVSGTSVPLETALVPTEFRPATYVRRAPVDTTVSPAAIRGGPIVPGDFLLAAVALEGLEPRLSPLPRIPTP